ncbi:MAG TPA: hypothetical protein VNU95_00080 [Candidatus Acidoferrales bacterium]|jgi:hypothetical protein|nr:hypothetical protein [Candidatus Acidoferrales bacterium]
MKSSVDSAVMAEIKVERSYYPNGQLQWEGSFRNEKLTGLVKHWHDNGILSKECPYDEGLEHGICKQWDKSGNLLGEYHMDRGTGTEKSWYENGQLERESDSVSGKLTGRFRCWMENGELISVTYYIGDKSVSKKKYLEACKSDSALPRYDDLEEKPKLKLPSTKYRQRETTVSEEERKQHDELIAKFRTQHNRGEARQWLAGDENRNIGEMTSEESFETIEDGYKAGAVKISAVDIKEESTNCLIVELPLKGIKRKKVFEWNNELAQSSGFDPDEDWGQNELFVFFS